MFQGGDKMAVIEGLAPVMLTNGLANAVSGSQGASGGESSSWNEGGSSNSAYSVSGSEGNSQSSNWSNVAGLEASANSALEAEKAHERQKELLQMAQEYNSKEAEKQRNWQADMANTVYTRSVKNMIEAGINPILAANLGLSAGNISGAASASVGAPQSFMGQTFAEQNSAGQSSSSSNAFSNSSEKGSSYSRGGSNSNEWSNSESGLATGLRQMIDLGEDALNAISSSEALKRTMDLFNTGKTKIEEMAHGVQEKAEQIGKDAYETFSESFKPNWSNYGTQGFGNWVH